MDEKRTYVRYCLSGHEVVYTGMCPSRCRICNNRINLSLPPITLEEAKAAREAAALKAAVPKEEEKKAEEVQPVEQEPLPAPNSSQGAEHTERVPSNSLGNRQPVLGGRQPVASTGVRTGMRMGQGAVRTTLTSPRQEAIVPTASPSVLPPVTKGFQLNYLGACILVPPEGGWLGRDALGAELFEGNRLISRRHVFIRPDENGRLIVQDDQSMNGVFYDVGKGRQKMERSSAVLLSPGDMLWLYNLPLKLEVMSHDQ